MTRCPMIPVEGWASIKPDGQMRGVVLKVAPGHGPQTYEAAETLLLMTAREGDRIVAVQVTEVPS